MARSNIRCRLFAQLHSDAAAAAAAAAVVSATISYRLRINHHVVVVKR